MEYFILFNDDTDGNNNRETTVENQYIQRRDNKIKRS